MGAPVFSGWWDGAVGAGVVAHGKHREASGPRGNVITSAKDSFNYRDGYYGGSAVQIARHFSIGAGDMCRWRWRYYAGARGSIEIAAT
jgi:hypothetical protein